MASLTPGRGSEEQRAVKRAALIAALETGHTRRAASQLAGINHTTLYAWIAADPTFSNAVSLAEAKAEEYYLDCIRQAAREDWRAGAWYMERRRAEDYARKDTVTVLARMAKELDALSDDDLLRIAAGDDGEGAPEACAGDPGAAGG